MANELRSVDMSDVPDVLRLAEEVARSGTTISRVTEDDEVRARQIIAQYDDKNFSLTDACSFAIMDRLGITQAFAFDAHFIPYGLSVLSPASFRSSPDPLRPAVI